MFFLAVAGIFSYRDCYVVSMVSSAITIRAIDALKPQARDAFLWDDDPRGFGLKITPAGRKVYVLQYRFGGGRSATTRRYTIGAHGSPWTPETARKEAKRLLARVSEGFNPAEERKQSRQDAIELAFSGYADEFLKQCVKKDWPKSYDFAEGILRLHVKPVWKRKPLPTIKKSDVIHLLDNIPIEKVALRRNIYAVVRRLFTWAVSRDDLKQSPMVGMEAPSEAVARDRVLKEEEIRVFWSAAGELGYPFAGFYRLLLVTVQRREEVAGLAWKELDRDASLWRLPKERAKNGRANNIPLSDLAIAIIDEIAGGDKWPRRGYVFSTTGKTSISGFSRGKRRLDNEMLALTIKEAEGDDPYPIEPWRIHDLRRTGATFMQALGIRFEVIEALTNHMIMQRSKVSAVYQRHDWAVEKRDAMRIWSAEIRRIVNIEKPDSNVVQLAPASVNGRHG
ncbi:tyrosine-type recombinase/integrase [Aquisediminimonas profunda]|uniref:tyrosine-type recombinase/integrase n=1 Tax=Aquisediminimonas profunda TaxID=1550733 RepID=UPI001FE2A3BA|nr:site-specific integrase [Aquisediminimonas profunda]